MAKGRMLNQSICRSKAVHRLSSDTCRLGFTWTISHLDVEGRVVGEPDLLRAKVFPRRIDISDSDMESLIKEWLRRSGTDTPLAVRYRAPDGDRVLWFPGFEHNQPGIRKDREAESELAPPPAELLRPYSGVTPRDSGPPSRTPSPHEPKLEVETELEVEPEGTPPPDGGRGPRRNSCSWCKPAPDKESDIQTLMRQYHDLYRDKKDECPVAFEGSASGVFKTLLTKVDTGTVACAVNNLFLSTDTWIVDHAYPITKLRSDFNALRDHPLHPPKRHQERSQGF